MGSEAHGVRSKTITAQEHDKLLKTAVNVRTDKQEAAKPSQHTRIVKTKMHVPIEEEIKVPVFRKEAVRGTTTKVVAGQKLVPVQKFREVEEKVVQMKEEVVKGYRTEWRQVKVPYTEVVKKPVISVVKKSIPYTDYEVQEVQKKVTVPTEEVKVKKGYRIDKHVGTKLVETEHEEVYEMKPVLVKRGSAKMKESRLPAGEPGNELHGKTAHGRPVFEGERDFDKYLHASLRHSASEGALSRPGTGRPGTGRPGTALSTHSLLDDELAELASRPGSSYGADLPRAQSASRRRGYLPQAGRP